MPITIRSNQIAYKNNSGTYTTLAGLTGPQGEQGKPGKLDSVSATIDNNTGKPSVVATLSGTNIDFAFHNLKGEEGSITKEGIIEALEYTPEEKADVITSYESPMRKNKMYLLGDLTTGLTITLPTDAVAGDMLYVSFNNNTQTVNIIGNLQNSIVIQQNCYVELCFMCVGSKWSVSYRNTEV